MGFLSGLFKKKPGGTIVGNLLRGVVNKASGGILGTGAGIITQDQFDRDNLSDADFLAKYAVTKQGYTVTAPSAAAASNQVEITNSNTMQKIKDYFKTDTGKIVGYVLIFGVLVLLWKKFGKSSKSKKGIFN